MNPRKLFVVAIVSAIAVISAACGSTSTATSQTGTLTVWLMNGSAPKAVVDGVNADFKAKYPNVTVNVEIQQWSDVTTKLDTAFGGSAPPDVMELGNTLVAKYASAGALANISGKKLMAKYGSDSRFSALYFPGKYWYAAAPFVWDFGGDIATQSGSQWTGAINSSNSQQGLTVLKNLVTQLSRADKTGDEAKQDQAFAQGHIAMIIANGWEVGVITDPKAGDPTLLPKLGAFPIPSHTAGQTAPVFLGGSDLGIAAKSQHQDLAREWIKLLGGTKFQSQMVTVGGVIPNSTSLVSLSSGLPAIFAAAAKNSRFTPNSPNWANVESANVLQDMLVSIFTNKASISDATKAASDKITQILNAGS